MTPGGARETRFIEAGGLTFETHVAGDANADKLALCLHGFPEHAYSWRFQLPLLAGLGYRVWAPNQRGYGETTRPRGVESYRIDHLVEDVGNLIDASGRREVLLVGHDWGGVVAWYAALRKVRPIARLVVMNLPHPTLMQRALRGNRAQRRRSWYVLFFQLPWLPEFLLSRGRARAVGRAFTEMAVDKSRFPDDVVDVFRNAASRPGALRAMIHWYRAAARYADRDEVARFPVLETPTLMVWGEEDSALGKELTYGTEELVRDFTLRYLPGVSHWVQQEAPEKVNGILRAWLEGRPVPRYDGGALPA